MNKSTAEIKAEAAAWIHRSEDPNASAETWTAREAWLAESPRHQVTFFRLAWGRQRTKELLQARVLDATQSAADEALHVPESCEICPAQLEESDLRPHLGTEMANHCHHLAVRRFPRAPGAVLAMLVVILFGAIMLRVQTPQTPNALIFKTEVGEVRHITLTDGSQIELNTASELNVKLSERRREVLLVRGEALFTVTHDPRRPFEVSAGGTTAADLGTQFSIRVRGNRDVDILVAKGRVGLGCLREVYGERALSPSNCETLLSVGDSATLRSGRTSITNLKPGELEYRLEWTKGQLEFRGEPLYEIVEELNRYSHHKIKIVDPTIAARRLGGTAPVQYADDILQGFSLLGIRSERSKENPDEILLSGAQQ